MMYFQIRHVKDWSILPWILSDDNGWEFTWFCFIIGVIIEE